MGEIETAENGEIEEEEQRAQSLDDDLKAIRNLAGCLMMRSSTQGFSLLRARERSQTNLLCKTPDGKITPHYEGY